MMVARPTEEQLRYAGATTKIKRPTFYTAATCSTSLRMPPVSGYRQR